MNNHNMINFFSEENKANIQSFSSQVKGCLSKNILNKDKKCIWLSSESLPQSIIINMENIIRKDIVYCFGIYCWHAYQTNPKVIELIHYPSNQIIGTFNLELKSGTQLFYIERGIDLTKTESIELRVLETFGGNKVYINNIFLYKDFPDDNSSLVTDNINHHKTKTISKQNNLSDSELSVDFDRQIEERLILRTKNNRNKEDSTANHFNQIYLTSDQENKSKSISRGMNSRIKTDSTIEKIKKNIIKSRNSSLQNEKNKKNQIEDNNTLVYMNSTINQKELEEDCTSNITPQPFTNNFKERDRSIISIDIDTKPKIPINILKQEDSPRNQYKKLEQQLLEMQREVNSLDLMNTSSDVITHKSKIMSKTMPNDLKSKTPDRCYDYKNKNDYNKLSKKGFDESLLKEMFPSHIAIQEPLLETKPIKKEIVKENNVKKLDCKTCNNNEFLLIRFSEKLKIKDEEIERLSIETKNLKSQIESLDQKIINSSLKSNHIKEEILQFTKEECSKLIKTELEIIRNYFNEILIQKENKKDDVIEKTSQVNNITTNDLKTLISDLFKNNIKEMMTNNIPNLNNKPNHKENTPNQIDSTSTYKKKFDSIANNRQEQIIKTNENKFKHDLTEIKEDIYNYKKTLFSENSSLLQSDGLNRNDSEEKNEAKGTKTLKMMDSLYKKLNEKDKKLKELRKRKLDTRESLNNQNKKEDNDYINDSVISDISITENKKNNMHYNYSYRFNDKELSTKRYDDGESLRDYLN